MGADQRFSLKWNNYQSHLVTAFESLLDEKDFVDVTLAVEGKQLPAHKMLLSACSPYFRELLRENPCQHPIIILRDIKYTDLNSLILFMYNGEVNVAQEQLNSFLKTAESLKIRGLTDMEDGDQDQEPKHPPARARSPSPPLPPLKRIKTDIPPASPSPLPLSRLPPPVKQEVIDIGEEGNQTNHHEPSVRIKANIYNQDHDNNGYGNETDRSDGAGYDHEGYNDGGNMEVATYDHNDAGNIEAPYDHGQHLEYQTHSYGSKVLHPSGSHGSYGGISDGVECPSCGKHFKSRRAWKNHNVVHESEGGQLLCKVCGKQQSSGTNYKRHLKTSHGIEGDPFSY